MGLRITHTWQCDVCGKLYQDSRGGGEGSLHPGMYVEWNWTPLDWNWIDGKLVCPDHTYTIPEPDPNASEAMLLRDSRGKLIGFARPER